MHTTSFWLVIPEAICSRMGRPNALEGLRGVAHALELVATLELMCDPRDIGRTIEDPLASQAGDAPPPLASGAPPVVGRCSPKCRRSVRLRQANRASRWFLRSGR
jgi:hypothetical protein